MLFVLACHDVVVVLYSRLLVDSPRHVVKSCKPPLNSTQRGTREARAVGSYPHPPLLDLRFALSFFFLPGDQSLSPTFLFHLHHSPFLDYKLFHLIIFDLSSIVHPSIRLRRFVALLLFNQLKRSRTRLPAFFIVPPYVRVLLVRLRRLFADGVFRVAEHAEGLTPAIFGERPQDVEHDCGSDGIDSDGCRGWKCEKCGNRSAL